MATKDNFLSFKDKYKSFNYCHTDTGAQYSDLNLNQNLKSTNIFPIQSNSKSYNNKKIDYTLSERYSNTLSLNDENEKCWKKNGSLNSTNNSTFSFHISAYENSNEDSSDSFNKSFQKSLLIQTQKRINSASKFVSQSPFEFQRQQNDKIPEPEVSQFKASQRLLNLNTSDLHSNFSNDVRTKHGFHKSFLYYIKTNSNPKVLFKLMQVSKYFCFKEFPFMVVKVLENDGENIILKNGTYYYDDKYEIYNNRYNKYENLPPLWITDGFWLNSRIYHISEDPKLASKLLSKIAYCKVKSLILGDQILDLNEFKLFVGSTDLSHIQFRNSLVKSANGTILSIEEILKLLPKLEYFEWEVSDEMVSTFTPETTKAMIDFFDPSILYAVELSELPQAFDFVLFAKFMDANPKIQFNLNFVGPLSAQYTIMLQEFVDDLIDTDIYKHRHIDVTFEGQTEESYEFLLNYYYGGDSPQASSGDGYDADESAEASSSEYDIEEYDNEYPSQASVADSPKIELEPEKTQNSGASVSPRSASSKAARSLYDINSSSDSMGSSSTIAI